MINYEQLTDDELNKEVAVRVMGWHLEKILNPFHEEEFWCLPHKAVIERKMWQPATSIAQAFEVVDKMIADGWFFQMYGLTDTFDYGVSFSYFEGYKETIDTDDIYNKSISRTICIASLKAVEAKEAQND